jgi:hypothetical protein
MLLHGDDNYLTLFSHKSLPSEKLILSDFIYKPMTRLIYEPGYFYLLNSQIPHMVINYGEVNRYILTLASYENEALSAWYGENADYSKYDEMVKELKELNLI